MEAREKDRILRGALNMTRTRRLRGYAVADYAPVTHSFLQQQPGVEEVRDYKGSDITVRFQDQTRVTILLGREQSYGGPPDDHGGALPASGTTYSNPDQPGWVKAGILDPMWDDWPPQSTPTSIVSTLIQQGYRVEHVRGQDVSLSFMTKLEQKGYGVVFIRTHGGMEQVGNDSKLHIMVRPYFDSWPPESGYAGVGVFYVGTNWGYKYAYAFNDEFVSTYMNSQPFPNTLVHLLVCYGASPEAENDMIPSLLNRGVGCYSGWTLTASSSYGDPAAVTFFQRMADGDTVAQASAHITASGSSPDPNTGAVLVAHGNSGMQLQLPFIGNRRSSKLHRATCHWAKQMQLGNIQFFGSVEDALARNYRACAFCLPQSDTG